jgi:catalase (peroxidase I)
MVNVADAHVADGQLLCEKTAVFGGKSLNFLLLHKEWKFSTHKTIMDLWKETIVAQSQKLVLNKLKVALSVYVNVFHATEAYSRLDLTEVKYNIRRLSIVVNEWYPNIYIYIYIL